MRVCPYLSNHHLVADCFIGTHSANITLPIEDHQGLSKDDGLLVFERAFRAGRHLEAQITTPEPLGARL